MPTLVRRLGLWSSIGLVIGITIGGGIFRTPAGIATRVPDPVLMMAVWIVGGIIVLCGVGISQGLFVRSGPVLQPGGRQRVDDPVERDPAGDGARAAV